MIYFVSLFLRDTLTFSMMSETKDYDFKWGITSWGNEVVQTRPRALRLHTQADAYRSKALPWRVSVTSPDSLAGPMLDFP